MDSNRIFTKLRELGHANSKRDELEDFCKTKFDQILKFLPRRLLNSDGADLLDCIFNGLPEMPSASCRQAVKIIDIVLQSMRNNSTSLTHCGDVISRVCLELSRQPVDDLTRWCNDSVQSIIQDNDVNLIWRDILPECLSALSAHNEVKHCGTSMTFDEYKQQCIHTLCQCGWTEKQLVQLAAMFKDMQLPRSEHKQVVNKICSYMIDIPPDVLPPLVHQLLKLCKLYNVDIVLAHLSQYFSTRLYSKLEPPPQDSESTTIDIDDIVPHSSAELSRCLSTCIYHITEGAAEPEVIRKHLKAWPRTQLLKKPFLLDIALAISDKGAEFKSACLDVIRLAIEQRVMDELRAKESSWVRSVMPPDVDVASVLKVLTTESLNHRQLTVMGLINLALSLLAVSKVKPVSGACWSYGKLVLVRLSKSQPETCPHILAQLADRLAGDNAQQQYADCLFVLCKLTPMSVERCAQLGIILENCQPSPADYRTAAAVLDAVHPLINFSMRTRDTLVMVCRKGLYSRDSSHRCLALSGFLSVLRHMKIARGTLSSSQSVCSEQFSAHSYLTQLTVDMHATQQGAVVNSRVRNEAMCMEVVSILRRCLVQDAVVKQLLYTKLYDCAKDKSPLHEPILELLYEHLSKYLPEDESGPPLLFDKCVQRTAISAVLTEPIAYLLYATAQFLQTTEEEDLEDILSSQNADTSAAHLKSKLIRTLDQLCSSESLGHIDMEDTGLADLTPESKAKCIRVQLTLQCYEALVAHRVMQWTLNSTDAAVEVYRLFKASNQLLEQIKTPLKGGKKGNKSLNETRDTIKSQKSQKSQKDKGKAPAKLSSLTKDRAGPFKPLPCLWDLRFCLRLIELLYSEEVSWSSAEARDSLRARRDFHRWALRGVLAALAAPAPAPAASSATAPAPAPAPRVDKRGAGCHVPRVAAVLYSRCLCRFRDMCDFDEQTLLGCIDVFKACLTLLLSPNYSLKIESFLPIITGITDCTAGVGIAAILEQIHAALELVEDESVAEDRDQLVKRILTSLVQTATLLLDTPVNSCPEISGVIIKLEEYLRGSKQDVLALVPGVLAAAGRDLQEAQFLDDLLLKLGTALGKIDEEDTSTDEDTSHFPTIDSRTGHTVLNYICLHLNNRFKYTEHLLARGRDLAVAQTVAVYGNEARIEREIQELYKSIVLQLCQLTSWCSLAGQLRCSVGGGSDRVLAACVRLYSALAALGKQLPAPHRTQRLERLLKLSGKKLSSIVDNLITYLEGSQQQQKASKVLRDTKLIPRLVLEAEQFSKNFILLSNKANLNLQQYLSLGTARDFRIRAPVLQEALQARAAGGNLEEQDNINDAETEVITPAPSDDEDASDASDEAVKPKRRKS